MNREFAVIPFIALVFSLICLGCYAQTPLALYDLKVVELDSAFRATDIFEGQAIGTGPDFELWMINVDIGTKRQLTKDGSVFDRDAVLSADYAAWIARSGDNLVARDVEPAREGNDVFLLNLHTGESGAITTEPAQRRNLQISGSRLLWWEAAYEQDGQQAYSALYVYDIEEEEKVKVGNSPRGWRWSSISGELVVWSDNRHSPLMGTSKVGCQNCPQNRFDIYLRDLSTGEERALVETGFLNSSPSIHGQRVVWQQYHENGGSHIMLLDLETGLTRTIAPGGKTSASPRISGSYVVWSVNRPHDVLVLPAAEIEPGAFSYNLETGEILKISNYVEPSVILHDKVAVIYEYYGSVSRQYAVFLE